MPKDLSSRIVVKRVKKVHAGGHGGGAWKIAYADFVTAMMAFFLLMWLLGSTARGDLEGVAEYFKMPLKVAMAGGASSGQSSSILMAGGSDLSRKEGSLRRPPPAKKPDDHTAQEDLDRLEGLRTKIEKMIDKSALMRQYRKQLLIDITTEGLRIQIVDEKNRPMFALAKADLQPYTNEILREIGRTLNGVPNRISLSGHTDAMPYQNGERGYSNWELSAERANASRRALVAGGLEEGKVLRVVGLSSAIPLDGKDLENPTNRRISIIVLNRWAEAQFRRDGAATAGVPLDQAVVPRPSPSASVTTEPNVVH
jgi:chemotaxis protein MotB